MIISKQQARGILSDVGWRMVKRGFKWYSRDMKWMVYQAGYLYKRERCSPSY